jgi:iron complex outermembrane receptor protein
MEAPDDAAVNQEIIVTALRREAKIDDVPLSIAAFTGDDLRARGILELREVAEQVSGVQIFRSNTGQPTWIIRGVGLVEFNPNNPPPASIYQDEVYQVTNGQGQLPMFDVDRVEVVKGPQGGTYGRNTTGGVVKIASKMPDLAKVEGNLTASYRRFDRVVAEGGVSVPLAEDKIALRVAGTVQQGGGWQRSLSDDRDWGDADVWALRTTLLAEPTGSLRIKLIGDIARDRSETPLVRASGARALPSEGGIGANLWCPEFATGSLSDSCRTYPGVLNALGFSSLPGDSPADQSRDGREVLSNAINKLDIDNQGLTLDVSLDLGGISVQSITAYRTFDYIRVSDGDGTGAELGHVTADDRFDIFSQEIRLQSDGDGPLTWAIGASYAHETLDHFRQFRLRDDPFSWLGFTAYGVTGPSEAVADESYDQTSRTYSGYVEVGYEFSETFAIQGALRYTDLEKTYTNGGFEFPLATGTVSSSADVQQLVNFELSETYNLRKNWTGNIYVTYRPATDLLLYASTGRGIKEGGFFGGFPGQGQSSIVPFQEEAVWSVEAGVKSTFADGRAGLNLAAFNYDYRDAQASIPVESATGAIFGRPGNVDARHRGVEADAFVVPLPGFRLSGSVTYLDAEFRGSQSYLTLDGGLAPFKGLQRPFAPEWSWTVMAAYRHDLGKERSLILSADANGRSTMFEPRLAVSGATTNDPAPTTRFELANRIEGFTLANARIGFEDAANGWSIAAFLRNLFDENYVVAVQSDGIAPNYSTFQSEPRSYGVELTFGF